MDDRGRSDAVGIIEKVKEQATHLKENETVRGITEKVKDKVEDVQAKRKAHVLIEDLGRFNYAERTNRAVPGAHIEIARRLAELRMLEESGVVILPEPALGRPIVDPVVRPAVRLRRVLRVERACEDFANRVAPTPPDR
jgi:hypothetical protein